jgi:hypothetical protein
MINAQGKHVAYSGGKPYVLVKDGKKIIQIPIDPASQQFACEIKTTFYNQYIAGLFDRRYRRRGFDDRTYFLNVLTARSNPMMQGWMLFFKCFFVLPIVMAPKHLFKGSYWGMHEVAIFIGLVLGFLWLDYQRTKSMRDEKKWWDLEIYHNGLQAVINTIQEKGW